MKRKGFTLIELLAVIVIIVVIALITTPTILGIILKSQKEAFRETAREVYKAAGTYEAEKVLDEKEPYCSVYNFSNNQESDYLTEEELDQIFGKNQYDKKQKYKYELVEKLSLNGTLPTEGIVSNCNNVYLGKLGNGKYTAVPDGEDIIITEGDDLSSIDKNKAVINNIGTKTTSTTITVTVDAEVSGYGKIKFYEYSIDGGTYQKGENTFTFEDLEFNSTHEIKVKVITNAGLVTEGSVTATTDYALLSVTANGYSGTYDGKAHSITVTSTGATIKYGTSEGTYNQDSSPAYTDVGTYIVYYKVTKAGYKTVTGSKTIEITKANGEVTLSSTSDSLTYPTATTITISKNTSVGTLSCISSNTSIATCSISGTTLTVTPGTTAGTATITVKSAGTTNYKEATATYTATVANGTLSVTANGYSGAYDGKAHSITVTSTGATIKYGKSEGTYNLTSSPTYTNVGTYTVYYQVTKVGYKTVTGSKTVVISKASGSVTLSNTSISSRYSSTTPITITVTKNTSGGTLSCSSSDTSIATCSISGTTVTIKGGTKFTTTSGSVNGTATITIKSAATTSYNAATATCSVLIYRNVLGG